MINFSLGIRIEGGDTGAQRIRRSSVRARQQLKQAAEARLRQTILRLQQEMGREYTSAWATGKLAKSLRPKVTITEDGVKVQISISNLRELEYVTAMGGGHFQEFPVTPFIITPQNSKTLSVPLPGRVRFFIQNKTTGRLEGSRPGSRMNLKQVLWGSKTGGFSRDVITEVSEEEAALFVEDVQQAVKVAIEEVGG